MAKKVLEFPAPKQPDATRQEGVIYNYGQISAPNGDDWLFAVSNGRLVGIWFVHHDKAEAAGRMLKATLEVTM